MSEHAARAAAGSMLLRREDLQSLFDALCAAGFRCIGPKESNGAIVFDELRTASELPSGRTAVQAPGSYRLASSGDGRCFAWANGPQGLKPLLFPPRETLWRTTRDPAGRPRFESVEPAQERLAVIGVRACDLAALALQDKHFLHHVVDPRYKARRRDLLVVAVDCSHPAATCFCASTGDGPSVEGGADLALRELDDGFLVRAYSDAGAAIRDALPLAQASATQCRLAQEQEDAAIEAQQRRLPGRNLRDALLANLDHPRWNAVAERCLACGNCVAVCPSCFCNAEREQPAVTGGSTEHVRQWDTCYSGEHAYLHGYPVRPDIRTRYRQWLTHKLGTWHDQYGRSGCVGCGRCIAWCPVGIDITEEANALCADRELP